MMKVCKVQGCGSRGTRLGLCNAHYMRQRRNGDTGLAALTTHGFAKLKTREYNSWVMARNRCNNPRDRYYPYYGGRGIKFSNKWGDFRIFLADMGPRPQGTTLDRIDGDGDYEPGNCKWSTYLEQHRNRKKRGITL